MPQSFFRAPYRASRALWLALMLALAVGCKGPQGTGDATSYTGDGGHTRAQVAAFILSARAAAQLVIERLEYLPAMNAIVFTGACNDETPLCRAYKRQGTQTAEMRADLAELWNRRADLLAVVTSSVLEIKTVETPIFAEGDEVVSAAELRADGTVETERPRIVFNFRLARYLAAEGFLPRLFHELLHVATGEPASQAVEARFVRLGNLAAVLASTYDLTGGSHATPIYFNGRQIHLLVTQSPVLQYSVAYSDTADEPGRYEVMFVTADGALTQAQGTLTAGGRRSWTLHGHRPPQAMRTGVVVPADATGILQHFSLTSDGRVLQSLFTHSTGWINDLPLTENLRAPRVSSLLSATAANGQIVVVGRTNTGRRVEHLYTGTGPYYGWNWRYLDP